MLNGKVKNDYGRGKWLGVTALFHWAYVVVTYVVLLPVTLLQAWTLMKLWAWFVVPTFALPPLNLPTAIGLGLLVSLVWYRANTPSDAMGLTTLVGAKVFFLLMTLGIGWGVSTFM